MKKKILLLVSLCITVVIISTSKANANEQKLIFLGDSYMKQNIKSIQSNYEELSDLIVEKGFIL